MRLQIQKAGVWSVPVLPVGVWQNKNETGLSPGWRANLSAVLTEAMPHLASGAILGVFLGDETMCDGVPAANFSAVANTIKQQIASTGGLVYANECSVPFDPSQHYAGSVTNKLPKGE